MWHGKPRKVTLNEDLTRYHGHLRPGVTGTLVPGVKTTIYGWQDRFGAVRFDCCGVTMDILLSNLTLGGHEQVPARMAAPAPASELEVAQIQEAGAFELADEVLDLLADLIVERVRKEAGVLP